MGLSAAAEPFITPKRRFVTALLPCDRADCRIDAAVFELSTFFRLS